MVGQLERAWKSVQVGRVCGSPSMGNSRGVESTNEDGPVGLIMCFRKMGKRQMPTSAARPSCQRARVHRAEVQKFFSKGLNQFLPSWLSQYRRRHRCADAGTTQLPYHHQFHQ